MNNQRETKPVTNKYQTNNKPVTVTVTSNKGVTKKYQTINKQVTNK